MADVAAPAPDDDQQPQTAGLVAEADGAVGTPPSPAADQADAAITAQSTTEPSQDPALQTPLETGADIAGSADDSAAAVAAAEAEPVPATPAEQPAMAAAAEQSAVAAAADQTPVAAVVTPAAEISSPAATEEQPAATQVEATQPVPSQPAASQVPSVARTIEVPAAAPAAAPGDEGGEWELLLAKIGAWINSGQLQQQLQSARTPLTALAALITLVLVLRIYGALLAVIDGFPLLSGLLELAGLIAVVRFALTRLVRSEDRREVIAGLRQRWQSFRGRG